MLYLFVFLGGFSSLVYQVLWQRLSAFSLGSDAGAAAIVAAAFMAGLGLGSLLASKITTDLKRGKALFLLILIEILIALCGLASLPLLYRFFYLELTAKLSTTLISTLVFLSLSAPTLLMGMSFPLVTKAAITELKEAPVKIAWLYAGNTAGAALGALVGGVVLMRHLGIELSIFITAAINFLAAGSVLPLWRRANSECKKEIEDPEAISALALDNGAFKENKKNQENKENQENSEKKTLFFWSLLYALSGFINLGLEIIWFRLLGVMLKSNTFTYSWLLFLYLSGLALGSYIAATKLKKLAGDRFLLMQLSLTAYTAIFLTIIYREAKPEAMLAWLNSYFAQYNPLEIADFSISAFLSSEGELIRSLYLGLACLMILPPTILMGISFYALQNTVHDNLKELSSKVALLQLANIIGGTLGLILLALVGLKYLGTFGSLTVLIVLNQLFLPVFLYLQFKREADSSKAKNYLLKGILIFVLSLLPCLAMPQTQKLWVALHGASDDFDFEEDHTGLSAIKHAYEDHHFVFINGEGHSEVPFGSYHTQVGLLPLFLHPNPEHVAIIGFGSGDTCFSASLHKETKTVTCIEIIESQPKLLERHGQKTGYQPLNLLFADPRIKIVSGDGRRYIESCGRKFDIIEADALRPFSSRAGMLYSKEYFEAMKNCLNEGGLLVTWLPTPRTFETFRAVFPHHLYFGNTAIGSNRPIELAPDVILARYRQFCLHEKLESTGHNGEDLIKQFLSCLMEPPKERAALEAKHLNTDLHPKDEFSLPQEKDN
ncbi:MAG: MFS transporter [Candidatus Melainabacteria bacterium]|nr:MFS transporter [Candidatus Melainabacteria bacterium]